MITYSEYEDYFQSLAKAYKPIAHTESHPRFAFMDIDSILSMSKTAMNMTDPCMILENPEGQLDHKNEKLRDENFGAFHILQHVSRSEPEKKREVMDRTKQIGIALIGRMFLDKTRHFKGQGTAPIMLRFFDLSQVKYMKVGPIFSECYGWRFEFNLGKETPFLYEEDDWIG